MIDANILLQGNSDLTGGINALFQGVNQFQNRDLTAQNKLFQKQGLANQMDEAEFKSIYNAAKPLMLQLESGDVAGAKRALEQRRESLRKIGLNTTQTDEGLDLLSQDPTGRVLLNNVKNIISLGDQRFSAALGNFGRLEEAVDKDGNPVFIQTDRTGKAKALEDFKPLNKAALAAEKELAVIKAREGTATGRADLTKKQIDIDTEIKKKDESKQAMGLKFSLGSDKINRMTAAIDSAIEKVGTTTAGFVGSNLANIPGTKARDLKAQIDTIRANIGFDELQKMRDSSPTGGALGNVSEKEIAFLQALLANLEQSQSPEQLKENLKVTKSLVKQSWARVQEAYKMDFGEKPTNNKIDVKSLSDEDLLKF